MNQLPELEFSRLYSPNDARRITDTLDHLLPHLTVEDIVLVGGLAIRYHVINGGQDYPRGKVGDLDIIAKDVSAIHSDTHEEFLIAHYHPQDSYLAIVDPQTRVKVDIFDWSRPPYKPEAVRFDEWIVQLRSAEDQLAVIASDLQKVFHDIKVDPKQFSDAQALLTIADPEGAQKSWSALNEGSMVKAIDNAEEQAKKRPDLLQKNPFRTYKPYCNECKDTDTYPLTPLLKIAAVFQLETT